MNHENRPRDERYPEAAAEQDDRELQALFRHASARQQPPEDYELKVRGALHAQWRDQVGRRRRNRALAGLGLAASLVLAVALLWRLDGLTPLAPTAVEVAQIVKRSGSILVHTADAPAAGAPRGQPPLRLHGGDRLETAGDSLLALAWTGGESIRLDSHTRLRLVSAEEVELLAGRVYVDTGRIGPGSGSLQIRTPAGLVQHIGTQYLAGLVGDRVEVSVREGRVAVRAGTREAIAERGEQITLAPDGTSFVRPVSPYGEMWAWTEQASPPIVLDGKTVLEFLQQVARESGRELAFETAGAEDLARTVTLSGTVDLPPMRALEIVLQTTELVADTDNGRILILAR